MFRWPVEISAKISARRPPAQRQNKTINQTTNISVCGQSRSLSSSRWAPAKYIYSYKMDLQLFFWKTLYTWPLSLSVTVVISPRNQWSVTCGPSRVAAGSLPPFFEALCLQSIRSIQCFHVILILGVIFSCRCAWTGGDGVFNFCKEAMDENMLIPKVWKRTTNWIDFATKKVQSETIVLELNVSIRELNFFKKKNHPLLQCLGRVQCFFISKDELGAKRGMFSSKWMGHKVP